MKYIFTISVLALFSTIFSSNILAQTPAFPGAEGAGMYTTGGRGGTVLFVTKLADDGTEGTLRWAINQSGARTIVFKVSGTIALTSRLKIRNGNLTIAGQTAPGDGITLKNYETFIDADNVIIRFLRFRMGDEAKVDADALGGKDNKNVIIDHCSMSWSVDETSSFYDNEDFTMQWCILAESLRQSVHDKGKHGYGGIWGGKKASFHHNMLFSHDSRNPRFCGSRYSNRPDLEIVDFRNNVLYNWGSNNAYGAEGGSYNMINNYYKPGPASGSSSRNRFIQPYGDDGSNAQPIGTYGKFYMSGNVMTTNATITSNNWDGVSMANGIPSGTTLANLKSETEFEILPVKTHSAEDAFDLVLKYAGSSFARDTLDRRYVREAHEGKISAIGSNGSVNGLIDTQTDAGGWPNLQSTTPPIDINLDGIPDAWFDANFPGKTANDKDERGYTILEVYLNSIVEEITEGQGYIYPEIQESENIFCGAVPTDGVIPEALSGLVTGGAISTAGNRNDACTENGYTWRTSDVTFTLPPHATFNANFTANGTRFVHVIINGDEANQLTYDLKSTSCIPFSLNLKNEENATLQIKSYGSDRVTLSQFSMTEMCITKQVATSLNSISEIQSQVQISKDFIQADATEIRIYNINGQLIKSERNTQSMFIGDLNKGVYITHVQLKDGSKENLKFVK